MNIQDGAIIIAGASRGLGRELAYKAYESNYPVALLARNKAELADLRGELNKINNITVSIHAVDLANPRKTQETFNDIAKIHKKVRGLVNCAATWTGGKEVRDISADDMNQSIMLNFFTAFNSIKAMLNLSTEVIQKPAAIINVGATASLRGSKKCAAFAVAKGALRQLSQSLARELWPENIHVAHLIVDGLIGNERTKKLNPHLMDDKFIDMKSLANGVLHIIQQERSCWTFEWDARPFSESW